MSRFSRLSYKSTLVTLLFLGCPQVAFARGTFPAVVQEVLELDAAPDCPICHSGSQSRDTANTDFVVALQNNGLDFGQPLGAIDEAQIRTALTAALAAADPAVIAAQGGVSPKYGCIEQNSSIAGSTSAPPRIASMVMAGLVAGVLLLRRRR